uniref:PKD_channel domain-containing protein n=1 Tax=Macrostomum lignano TaxID=282301 RepID=A0A1I8FDU6_9PLAT
ETLDVVSPVRVLMEDSEQPSTTMWERTEQLVGMVEEAKREQSGTLHPAENFRPTEDAEAIQRALNESPVDQKSIIDILTRRVASQRAAISAAFADIDPDGQCLSEKFPEPGAPDAKDFDRLCGLLCLDQSEFDACQLRQALESPQADEASLIEIFCSRTQSKIEAAKMAYRQKASPKTPWKESAAPFKTLLNGLAGRSRPEGAVFDCDQARRDGRTLARRKSGRLGCWRPPDGALDREEQRAHAGGVCRVPAASTAAAGGIENLASMVKLRVPAGVWTKTAADAAAVPLQQADHDDRVVLRVVISRCERGHGADQGGLPGAHGDALASCLRGLRWRVEYSASKKSTGGHAVEERISVTSSSCCRGDAESPTGNGKGVGCYGGGGWWRCLVPAKANESDEAASPDDENHVKATLRELVIYCCFSGSDDCGLSTAPLLDGLFSSSGNLSAANATARSTIYYETVLLGVAQIRQVRVGNRTCKVAKPFRGVIGWCHGAVLG